MHLGGLLSRQRLAVRVMHLAEILAATRGDGLRESAPAASRHTAPTFVGTPPFPTRPRGRLADTQLRHEPRPRDHDDPRQAGPGRRRGRRLGGAAPGRRRDQGRGPAAPRRSSSSQLEADVTAAGGDGPLGPRRRRGERDRRPARAGRTAPTRSSRSSRWPPRRSSSTRRSPREGIAAWETDLAELIVQLGDDLPIHILVPAIHRNRAEIREIFRREMAAAGRPAPDDLTDEPRRARRGGAAAPAREVPAREGRRLRRELRGRRDRHARGRRVRGQRPDVPDAARGAGLGRRHREGGADAGRTSTCSCSCCRARRPASG